jgi:hypothetical protein
MTERPTSDLRSLAKDYANGRLSLEDYRQRRTQLIDDIASGARPIAQAPRGAWANDDTLPAFPTSAVLGERPSRARLPSRALLLGALLVCALAAALFLAL